MGSVPGLMSFFPPNRSGFCSGHASRPGRPHNQRIFPHDGAGQAYAGAVPICPAGKAQMFFRSSLCPARGIALRNMRKSVVEKMQGQTTAVPLFGSYPVPCKDVYPATPPGAGQQLVIMPAPGLWVFVVPAPIPGVYGH